MPNLKDGFRKWKRTRSDPADGARPRSHSWLQSTSSLCHEQPHPRSAVDLVLTTQVIHVPDIPVLDTDFKPTRTAIDFSVSSKGSEGSESNFTISTDAPTIVVQTSQTIWDEALERLTPKQKTLLCNFPKPIDSDELINAVRSKQGELEKLSWASHYKLGNKTYNIKKMMDSVIIWIDRFKSIGDIIVQYDPAHIALPWAGIRFLLQVAVEDKANMTAIALVLERATNVIAMCSIYIELYLGQFSSDTELLKNAIVELYAEILRTLVHSIDYFHQPYRTFKSIFEVRGFDDYFASIDKLMLHVNEVVGTVHLKAQNFASSFQRDAFANLHSKLQGMDSSLEKISFINEGVGRFMEDTLEEEFLKWLSPCPHLKHHLDAGEDILENTGGWLFESNSEFQRWEASTVSAVLWLTGSLGVGKTKLTHARIKAEQKQDPQQRPVIYFYCSQIQGEPERVRPEIILGTLLKQLLPKDYSCYPPELRKRYEERKALGALRIQELQRFLQAMFKEYSQTIIFIEAIDEIAAQERHKLLLVLGAFTTEESINVKIWISSRGGDDIRRTGDEVMMDGQNQLEIKQYIQREITKHIKDGQLLNGNVDDKLRAHIINMLTEKSEGMFLWAALQIKALCRLNRRSHISETLCNLPTDLKAMYGKIYQEILNEHLQDCQIALMAFRWLISAKRQLTLEELVHAAWLSVTLGSGSLGTVEDALQPSLLKKICHGFITVDKQLNVVRFCHPSVQEYLQSRTDFNDEAPERVTAKTCLAYLQHSKPMTGPFSKYIIKYWSAHCKFATQKLPTDELILHELLAFLCPSEAYERWLSDLDDDIFYTDLDPLFVAARYGLTGVYQKMLAHRNQVSTPRNRDDKTPLHVAAQFGHADIINLYRELGQEDIFNDVDKNGWTPLTWAVLCDQGQVVKLLLSSPFVDVNKPDYLGQFTPLARAAWRGHSHMVRLLVGEPRVDIEKTDVLGMTPLVWAARRGDIQVMNVLIRHGANVNACDYYKRTALHWVLISKEMKALQLLTQTPKIDLNPLDVNGMTPLFYACKYHNPKLLTSTLKILLAVQGVDINCRCWSTTPLIIVAGAGHEEAVRLFVQAPGIKLSETTIKNRTSLMMATLNNRKRCVQVLLNVCSDAELRHTDTSGKTALVYALEKGYDGIAKSLLSKEGVTIQGHHDFSELMNITDHDEILAKMGKKANSSIRTLNPTAVRYWQCNDPARNVFKLAVSAVNQDIKARRQLLHTDVNVQNACGETGLHLVAQHSDKLAALNILLAKPDIVLNPKDMLGKTPLIHAVQQGCVEVVRQFLSHPGVDPNICDHRGRTALWYSTRVKLQSIAIVELLVGDERVDINAADNQSVTPISQAVQTKATKAASILLETGKANVNLTDHMGFTPLTYAAMKGPPSSLKLLLKIPELDIECQDDRWYTPLALAAKYGQEESVAALIGRGANLDARTNRGLTPVQVAEEYRHAGIVKLLKCAIKGL